MASTTPDIIYLNTIAHEGKVLVFGIDSSGAIHYTVRQSGFEDSALKESGEIKDPSLAGFENWKPLALGQSINDPSVLAYEASNLTDNLNNQLLLSSLYGDAAASFCVAPVKLLSSNGHICLFALSQQGYLTLSRFILDGMTNELIPKLEVRYRRSQQKLTPEKSGKSTQDSLDYRDINDLPFYEPTLQLNFLGKFDPSTPWFSVELINTNEHDKYRWNFFVYTQQRLKLVSVAMSGEGRIDLGDRVKIQNDPESSEKKVMSRLPGIVERTLTLPGSVVNGFDSTLYFNQVSRQTKAGTQLMKEGAQVMLSVPLQLPDQEKPLIASISFAANNQGMLAQVDRSIDESQLLRGKVKELLLPLTTLDDIKLIADQTPPPMGTIAKLAQGEEELLQVTSLESIEDLRAGNTIKISGTKSYNGCYVAKNVDGTTFEIDAIFDEEDEQGFWEVIEDDEQGLVFENMIASYEKTAEGGLRISCVAHNLMEGDEIKISGSINQDGQYPLRQLNGDDNSFVIDNIWPSGEVINLSRIKRRGLYFDGNGDYLTSGEGNFEGHKPKHNLARSIGCWVFLDRLQERQQTIIKSAPDESYHLYIGKDGRLTFTLKFADGYSTTIKDSASFTERRWVHVTAIWNYQGESTGETQMTLARDGIVCSEKAIPPAKPLNLPGNNLQLNGERLAIDKLHYNEKGCINAITVEAWINTKQDGEGIIASFDRSEYWRLAINGNKSDRHVMWCTRGESIDDMTGTLHLEDNKWYHIAATYDVSSGEKRIYVNGQLDSAKSAHNGVALGSGALRYGFIGVGSEADKVNGNYNQGTEYKGLIADVRIWDIAQPQEVIEQQRHLELSGIEPNLVANWYLQETLASKLIDITRGKQHLLKPTGIQWKCAPHRVPGSKEQLLQESYQQSFSIAAAPDQSSDFRGKLSSLQIWQLALPRNELKTRIYNTLSGTEYGLVGYWKLGGIAHEGEQRISPDFSSNQLDAVVYGETYVAACELSRSNSVGRAVRFSNDDLVAVSQGACYQESFEFRALRSDDTPFTLDEINDADGMRHPLFQFNYWGKKARTSEEKIPFSAATWSMHEFEELGDGWFKAKTTFTVPEGVNMIRCFEIDKVSGKWRDELAAPQDEWQTLNIRKHKIELISDSISKELYTDELDLPLLLDNATELESAIQEIPRTELTIASQRKSLTAVLEEIELYENVQKFETEKASLENSTKTLTPQVKSLKKQLDDFSKDPLNYQMVWKAKEAGRVLDLSNSKSGSQVYIYGQHFGNNQAWEFVRQNNGYYKIRCLSNKQYLSAGKKSENLYIASKHNDSQYWSVASRGKGYYSIHNKANGLVLDVYGHGKSDKSRVVLWPYNGQNNQMWQLCPYTQYDKQIAEMEKLIKTPMIALNRAFKADLEKKIAEVKKQFPMGEPKSTYKDEYSKLEREYQSSQERLSSDSSRLKRVTTLLANRSAERLKELKSTRDQLIKSIASAENNLNTLNQRFLDVAKTVQNEPQQMTLLTQDKQGLKTYGALLGFASPRSSVHSLASSEGNVQLNYFDQQGRMRNTLYDACADEVNSSYEEWLPSNLNSCALFARADALAKVAENGIELPTSGFSIEAWFYYPPAYDETGVPYWLNMLTSDATGQEAVIAILENRRLGTLVDGFFHDSGWDMAANLSLGWHHVAAVAKNGNTLFYVDGQKVGLPLEEQQTINRQAMVFNGKNSYLQLPEHTLEVNNGFTVQCWVKFDAFNHWSRIIDFGNGANSDNIVFANEGGTNNLVISIRQDTNGQQLIAKGVLPKGVWTHVAATIDSSGTSALYVNGQEVAYGDCHLPNSLKRSKNYIGRSNWSHDKYFAGEIHDLQLWSRSLSINEIQNAMFNPLSGEESGLSHAWSMTSKEVNGNLVAFDKVEEGALHGTLCGGAISKVLNKQCSQAITTFGNSAKQGAPFGRLAELRIWHSALDDAEIKANSRFALNSNEPDLAHYYPLNDVAGGKARDHGVTTLAASYSASTQEIACTAPLGNPGNQVFQFDGVDDNLTLSGINLSKKSFTIEFWVKRDEADRAEWILSQGNAKKNQLLHLGFRDADTYAMGFYANDLNIDHNFAPQQWMHIANVYDADAKTQSVYLNGQLLKQRSKVAPFEGSGELMIGMPGSPLKGQLADLRIWNFPRSNEAVQSTWQQRLTGKEKGLIVYLPLNDSAASNKANANRNPRVNGAKLVFSNDLPIIQGAELVCAEYQTVGLDPASGNQKRAMLRRFFGYAAAGDVTLIAGKRIEELQLKWIGNAQFEPTLLGYIEGAPPVPSENLTVNYDYDGATSVQLTQSEDTSYSWMRSKDVNQGVDLNLFLGAGWGAEGGFGVVSKISEGKAGFRGMLNIRDGVNKSSTIRANSTNVLSDRLELRGAFETESKFPLLGNRYVPKNVGYALVVSGLADVFITQMKRSGRMVGYEVLPVEDVPPDINTITFMINPAYTINGSLDGLVGSNAADARFCAQVPEMRAQYGSLYPNGYYNLKQAYEIKAQIDRWDKERESYFINYDATQTTLAALQNQTADASEYDSYGGVEVDDSQGAEGEEARSEDDVRNETKESYKNMKKSAKSDSKKRKEQIAAQNSDLDKQVEANAAFDAWQQRMENLQIRAAKRNIVNTYVWDADGGMRSEEQSFANTVEHTIGGSFSISGSAGLDTDVMVTGFKFELQALYAAEMTQTMSKTLSTTNGFDLNVRLDGVERKGVTDERDYPILPGEKVDRYRFMSYYLEGNTDHFNDFFNQVVDPEWLMSNDEEARALRQVANGRANKCWRVMHRVTYVERPALMGFGEDLRSDSNADVAAGEVFNYFDALEQANDALRADISELKSQLEQLGTKIDQLDEANEK